MAAWRVAQYEVGHMRSSWTSVGLVAITLLVACTDQTVDRAGPSDPSASHDPASDPASSPDGTSPSGQPPTPGGAPSCAVTKAGTSGLLLHGRVLAGAGPIDGEVLVDDKGAITCVAATCASRPGASTASVVTCEGAGAVIAPGLVNGHDHTEYATRGPITHGNQRWTHRNGWRTGAAGEQALPKVARTTDDTIIAAQELRFLLSGTTSVVGSGGVRGLLRNLASAHAEAEMEGLPGKAVDFDTFPLGDSNGTVLSSGCAYPSIRSTSSAFALGAYAPHVAEGIAKSAENELSCMLQSSLLTAQTAIIHGVGLNAKDVDAIAKAGTKVIWSARTNVDLYGETAPITQLAHAGVTIGLGTDWLASGSMNMLRELACASSLDEKYFDHVLDDRALFETATKNNGAALGWDGKLGVLAEGAVADIAVFTTAGATDYRAVIDAGVEDVALVLRGGKVLHGDATLVDALAKGDPTCAELPMCGRTKKVCVDVPSTTLAQLQQAASGTYPLFFCKTETPKDEPSCTPYRDAFPNGTSATDHDGDGVPDATDLCPTVFDPPRPMDGTRQADVDGDGHGDACDLAPLDPAKH